MESRSSELTYCETFVFNKMKYAMDRTQQAEILEITFIFHTSVVMIYMCVSVWRLICSIPLAEGYVTWQRDKVGFISLQMILRGIVFLCAIFTL